MTARRAFASLALALVLPTASPAAPPAAVTAPLSVALARLGECGETMYEAVKSGDWSTARRQLTLARQTGADVAQQWSPNSEMAGIESALSGLDVAIKDRRRDRALREANRLTLVAAEMASAFDPPVPLAVSRLDYLGRELEIWSQPNDERRLHATVADIRGTWDRLRPGVDAKREARLVAEVDGLVRRLQSAQSGLQYRTLARALLDAVDRLEVVFKKEHP
jgi:hypothetical protein